MANSKTTKVSAEELEQAVNDFFAMREEQQSFPDEPGMIVFICDRFGISFGTYRRYNENDSEDEENIYKEHAQILTRARLLRESWLCTRMATDNKAAQGCLNNLKQPKNGGYIDKPSNDAGAATITLRIDGVGGSAAFG